MSIGKTASGPTSFSDKEGKAVLKKVFAEKQKSDTDKFKQHTANKDGWCDWDTPVMKGYRMACCDCDLVHEVEFRVLEVIKEHEDGSWSANDLDDKKYRVKLRMKREWL